MKSRIVLAMLLSLAGYFHSDAQKDTVQLQNLKVPVSPGFALLDLSPTAIESPTSPKMMALQVLNYMSSGTGGFPKNFSFEFSPYWISRRDGETIYKYLGLPDEQSTNMASGVFRKLSVSASVYSNDTATHLLPHTSYISGGVRTNLLTIWGKAAGTTVKNFLRTRNQLRQEILRNDPMIDLNTMRNRIDSAYNVNTVNALTVKPMLVLDAAFALSEAFTNDDFNNKRFNRSAWWLNATVNIPPGPQGKDNFFLIFYYRNLRDNLLTDTVKNVFNIRNATDLGVRAGYESGPFQISVEHINRKYRNIKGEDTYRTTGIIQFRMNDGIYLMGSFGKNFSQERSLFTMLGINWGLGKQALVL